MRKRQKRNAPVTANVTRVTVNATGCAVRSWCVIPTAADYVGVWRYQHRQTRHQSGATT